MYVSICLSIICISILQLINVFIYLLCLHVEYVCMYVSIDLYIYCSVYHLYFYPSIKVFIYLCLFVCLFVCIYLSVSISILGQAVTLYIPLYHIYI